MAIRQAKLSDVEMLVEIDQKAFGETGATREYFMERLSVFPQGVLVVEESGKVTGFSVIAIMEKNAVPPSFSSLKLDVPIRGRSMFCIAFTTRTHYMDKKEDAKLLAESEKVAKSHGCREAFVELSEDHPYAKNGVYGFWETNDYRKCGTIDWDGPKGKIPCNLLRKTLE